MLSEAKHLYHGVRDPSVAEKRSLMVTCSGFGEAMSSSAASLAQGEHLG
jgi:hypothetical protein